MAEKVIIRGNKLNQPVVNDNEFAKAIQESLNRQRQQMREKLKNWGRWMNRDNQGEIDKDTGKINISISGRIIDFAPFQDKSGYYAEPSIPIDIDEAELLHIAIQKLDKESKSLVKKVYEEHISYKFLASIYRCSISSIERRMRNALDQLCDNLQIEG